VSTHVPVVRPGWPTAPAATQPGPQGFPAYSYPPAGGPRVASATRLKHHHLLGALLGGLAGVAAVFIVISVIAPPAPPDTCQTLVCQVQPPTGAPVQNGALYTDAHFGFTARIIDDASSGVSSSMSKANGVLTINYSLSGTPIGYLELQGVADKNAQTAEQLVDSVISQNANGAQLAYVIPGAMIGYQPGYGAAYNYVPNSGSSQSQTQRLIVMASVRDGLAIVAIAVARKVVFGDGQGQLNPDEHVSIADSIVALVGDPVLNSVLWPGQTFP
jgi:hypothetical protein